jgi:hypothetical protein
MAPPKAKKKINLGEAVSRMHKSLKRQNSTPPKPYHSSRQKAHEKPSISLSRRPKH